jgi:O-antigen/teichoic acid export membrane protein
LKRAWGSPVARGLSAIIGGTAAGHLAGLVASPALSRLFTPAEFGTFTVVLAIALTLAPAMALRFELAVPLPKDDSVARALVLLGLAASIVTALTTSAVAISAGGSISKALGVPSAASWLPAAPLIAMTLAWFALLNQWALRQQRYALAARRNLVQGVSTVLLQIGAGWANLRSGGLLGGYAGGQLLGILTLLPRSHTPWARQPHHLAATARRFVRFPLYLAPAGMINAAGVHLPTVLIGGLFGVTAAGWFGLAQRILAFPMMLLGHAVAQVYLSELAKSQRDSTALAQRIFLHASRRLLLAAAVSGMAVLTLAPMAFPLIFGTAWATSGLIAQALALSLAAQLVASPVSPTLVVYERTALQLGWDAGRLAVVTAAVVVPWWMGAGLVACTWSLSVASAGTYAVSWWLSRAAIRASVSER